LDEQDAAVGASRALMVRAAGVWLGRRAATSHEREGIRTPVEPVADRWPYLGGKQEKIVKVPPEARLTGIQPLK
jgi:hypothetical protein